MDKIDKDTKKKSIGKADYIGISYEKKIEIFFQRNHRPAKRSHGAAHDIQKPCVVNFTESGKRYYKRLTGAEKLYRPFGVGRT